MYRVIPGSANGGAVDQCHDNGDGAANEFSFRTRGRRRGSYKIVKADDGLEVEDYGFQIGKGAKVDR